MAEANYTLKLTLAEASIIKILVLKALRDAETRIQAAYPDPVDVHDTEEHDLLDQLARRL